MAVDAGVPVDTSTAAAVEDSGTVPPARDVPHWVRRVAVHIGVIAVFTVPSFFLWWHAWSSGPGSTVRCACFDPAQQVWFTAWPAYALSHGLDPFFSNWLWPPHGVNLLDNASSPLVGLVLSPVTWLLGPFTATTVAVTLAPGLSAWGCWLACRRIATWRPSWWVAGFLFGYSPAVIQNVSQGHLSVGLLVVPPLMFIVLHEILVRQQWSPISSGAALGVLVLLQFLVSAEVLTVTAVVAVAGIVVAALVAPRRAIAAAPFAIRAFAVAALVSFVLMAFPVWEMLKGPEHIKGSVWSGLQAFFTSRFYDLWSAGNYRAVEFGTLVGPTGEFLGIGMIGLFLASLVFAWRRRSLWIIAAAGLVATVFSWGGTLWLSPNHVILSSWLPWGHILNWPVLDNLSPKTFAVMEDLAVALVIGIGLDALRSSGIGSRLRGVEMNVVAVAAVVLAMVPIWVTYNAPFTVDGTGVPTWYATVARHIPEGSVVLSFPFPTSETAVSQPLMWQAVDGLRFRLAGGYVKVPAANGGTGVIGLGPPNSATRTLDQLTTEGAVVGSKLSLTPVQLSNLRAAIVRWNTSYIVMGENLVGAGAVFTAATGQVPQLSEQSWVWDLRAHPLGATYNAKAAARALAACVPRTTRPTTPLRGHTEVLNRCIPAQA